MQLKALVIKRKKTDEMVPICQEIITSCEALLPNYPKGKLVHDRLMTIRYLAYRAIQSAGGINSHGIPITFNYRIALDGAEYMESCIQDIGKELKIEFEQTQT